MERGHFPSLSFSSWKGRDSSSPGTPWLPWSNSHACYSEKGQGQGQGLEWGRLELKEPRFFSLEGEKQEERWERREDKNRNLQGGGVVRGSVSFSFPTSLLKHYSLPGTGLPGKGEP